MDNLGVSIKVNEMLEVLDIHFVICFKCNEIFSTTI